MEQEKEREIVGYAAAEFHSAEPLAVQIRTASVNALKIWLNGELVDEHEVYHGGSVFDQYKAAAILQPGRNVILVKACQNAQSQDWAEVLSFQLRVCDEIGTRSIRSRSPAADGQSAAADDEASVPKRELGNEERCGDEAGRLATRNIGFSV